MYDSIVRVLAAAGLKTGLTQWRIETGLINGLGASQPATLRRHLELMVKLGYLKKVGGNSAYSSAEYDLVGAKVKELTTPRAKPERVAAPRRGRPRT